MTAKRACAGAAAAVVLLAAGIAAADRRADAEPFIQSARRAATRGDCATAMTLVAHVGELDRDAATGLAREDAIAGCDRRVRGDHRHGGLGGKLGIGAGLPYGGHVGFRGEIGLPYVAVVGGIGALREAMGWSVGVRGYLLGRRSDIRLHLTATYGTVGMFQEPVFHGDWDVRYHPLTGFGVFAGFDVDLGDPGAMSLSLGIGAVDALDLPDDSEAEPWTAGFTCGLDYQI